MAHTITGKLNKAATTFQAGDSIGFGLRIGVQYYDRETKQKEWTNYEAVIFAKPGAQADFYASSLVEGSIVEVSGPTLKIKRFEGQNSLSLSIEIVEAKVGYIGTAGTGQPKQQAQQGYSHQPAQNACVPQQQQVYAPAPQQRPAPQPQQQQYQQAPQNFTTDLNDGWDSDIPF